MRGLGGVATLACTVVVITTQQTGLVLVACALSSTTATFSFNMNRTEMISGTRLAFSIESPALIL